MTITSQPSVSPCPFPECGVLRGSINEGTRGNGQNSAIDIGGNAAILSQTNRRPRAFSALLKSNVVLDEAD